MAERKSREPQQDLEDRIGRLRDVRASAPDRTQSAHSGFGFGMRIGVELVAALIIGVGIGLTLDYWFGSKPWLMVTFFVIGAAAGIFNVFRVVTNQGGAVGYQPISNKKVRSKNKDQNGE